MKSGAKLIKRVALLSIAAMIFGAVPAFAQVSQEVVNDVEVQAKDSMQNQYKYQYRKTYRDSAMNQVKNQHRYQYKKQSADSMNNKDGRRYRRNADNVMKGDSAIMKRERKRMRDENCDGVPDSTQIRTRKRTHSGNVERKGVRNRMKADNSPSASTTGGESGIGSQKRRGRHGGHN